MSYRNFVMVAATLAFSCPMAWADGPEASSESGGVQIDQSGYPYMGPNAADQKKVGHETTKTKTAVKKHTQTNTVTTTKTWHK